MSDISWAKLRGDVKNCPFSKCPRNNEKLPIFFNRSEESLSKIRFFVVSQEPGFSLRKKYNSTRDMEEYLIKDCLQLKPKRTSPINKIIEIFGKFDPLNAEIYWTHALKCVPCKSDNDIKTEWESCAPCCLSHLKNELNSIPSKNLALIPLGNYALALCRNLFGEPLSHPYGILEYIRSADPEKKFSFSEKGFSEKEISLFPFLHPSHREQILKLHDRSNEVKNKENKFIERIRQLNPRNDV